MIKYAIKEDADLRKLLQFIKTHDSDSCKRNLPHYYGVFQELTEINGVVVRGRQIVIPKSLQANVIAVSHEGHQCADKTLKLLRESNWFPKMRKAVNDYVDSCIGCNASNSQSHPVPLEPNLLPDRPWQKVHADFKGPIGEKFYLHVVIDQYSKYPEVDLVTSTAFKKLKPVLNRIFATHGIPEEMTSDNGPPYDSHDMKTYAAEMGISLTPVAPKDPQGNGFAENFVKSLCKMVHIAIIEDKDPKTELYTFLLHYRATPHGTTGVSPAEMLFGRRLQTKLPQIHVQEETEEKKMIRERHDKKRLDQKKYFDKRHKVQEKKVSFGDKVMVKQQKSTTKPPYDPRPYTVTGTKGNKVEMERGDGSKRVRDKNQIKVLKERPQELEPSWNNKSVEIADYGSFDIESSIGDFASDFPKDSVSSSDGALRTSPSRNQESVIEPENQEDDQDESNLFDLDEEGEARMQLLLEAASEAADQPVDDNKRVTRSKGMQLNWNPRMNDKDVLLSTDDDQ